MLSPSRNWLAGLTPANRLWRKAYDLHVNGERDRAVRTWELALDRDPELADALLGLHVLRCERPGLLADLTACVGRLGECQRRFERPLRSRYRPLGFAAVPLSDADDVRLARARELIADGDLTQARALIDDCEADNPLANAVAARMWHTAGDFNSCIQCAQSAFGFPQIEADVRILLGMALSELALHEAAREELAHAMAVAANPVAMLAAQYQLALAHERAGDVLAARREHELILAQRIDYLDVSDRLAALPGAAA